MDVIIDIEGLQNLCSCLVTMAFELMTAMTQNLGLQVSIQRTAPFSRPLRQAWGTYDQVKPGSS